MVGKVDFTQSFGDFIQTRRGKPGPGEHDAEWIDVASHRHTPEQSRFQDRRPAAHEWIIDPFAGGSEPLDEKTRKLRLETSPIGHLMEGIGGPLPSRPELVHKSARID